MPEFLCYFAQIHESFRVPELQALSDLFAAELEYCVEEYVDTGEISFEAVGVTAGEDVVLADSVVGVEGRLRLLSQTSLDEGPVQAAVL